VTVCTEHDRRVTHFDARTSQSGHVRRLASGAVTTPTRPQPSQTGERLPLLDVGIRPWGSWVVLDDGDGYKVKRLRVRPHHRLSLQRHEQRCELWVVISGTATCTVGSATFKCGPGGIVNVPRGYGHRLANETGDSLVVIEMQVGLHTEEDDIVRLADDYGRSDMPTAG
jgi:mannose-6-phosphate isomerase